MNQQKLWRIAFMMLAAWIMGAVLLIFFQIK